MAEMSETTTVLVTLTPDAAVKVRELLEAEGNPDLGLRLFVAGGGCSGMQYGMTLDEIQEGDEVLDFIECHAILHARAAAARDEQAQSQIGIALGLKQFTHFHRCVRR